MHSFQARFESFGTVSQPQRGKSVKSNGTPKWPHPSSFLANPSSLADAGFYYDPASGVDAVACFMCGKQLAEWLAEDDPAEVHADKRPDCAWAMLKCINDLDKDGNLQLSGNRIPSSKAMEKARLETFVKKDRSWRWPHDSKGTGPNSKKMAKAGFIYAPANKDEDDDTCTCIYCGVELSGWEPSDDPIEEHRRRQTKHGPCSFFMDISKGSDAPKRGRSKSKAPSVRPDTHSDDEPQHPAATKPTKAAVSRQTSTKPKASKKAKNVDSLQEEIVAEYQIPLDQEEDTARKPSSSRSTRSKSASRSRSRSRPGAKSQAASIAALVTDSERDAVDDEEDNAVVQPIVPSDPVLVAEKPKKQRGKSKDPQPKRARSQRAPRSKKSSQATNASSANVPSVNVEEPPSPAASDDHYPQEKAIEAVADDVQPDEDDMAREEEALEAQAQELMRAAGVELPNLRKDPLVVQQPAVLKSPSPSSSLPGKIESKPMHGGREDIAAQPDPPLELPGDARKESSTAAADADILSGIKTKLIFTEEERTMTVEEWIRYEMDKEFERQKMDGRQQIDAFIARAADVAKQIEDL
ncbi:hypothetical protein M422DRAFT_215125 [Sphaerobolus stellatus SS14]|uniref:Unplaced genomic scaffold SPHSTscaffold_215, whole genome shotgun sequence n=1 Tax=Sphaerobolus stellatus (strain SS14) TaxID=990650 RepID=A0A0C9UJN5_SPHS4|nr:hypothetical protein M422DRAFT_215125 [Sphaerobolus stellatus SS14]